MTIFFYISEIDKLGLRLYGTSQLITSAVFLEINNPIQYLIFQKNCISDGVLPSLDMEIQEVYAQIIVIFVY